MRRVAVALLAVAAVAAGVVWLLRIPVYSVRVYLPADELAKPVASAPPPASWSAVQQVAPAVARLAELEAMSDSVRNGTFVVAIRNAGFVCEDVIGVDQGEPGAPVWRARCPDLRAYLVSVRDDGTLGVEPTLDHWDAVFPVGPAPSPPRGGAPDLLTPPEPRR